MDAHYILHLDLFHPTIPARAHLSAYTHSIHAPWHHSLTYKIFYRCALHCTHLDQLPIYFSRRNSARLSILLSSPP